MKMDITDRADVEIWMHDFIQRLVNDPQLRPFFMKVGPLDLKAHKDKIVDFWAFTLLEIDGYRGDLMDIHLELNREKPIRTAHFERWLLHFDQSLATHYRGPVANMAGQKARSIARLMEMKIKLLERQRKELEN